MKADQIDKAWLVRLIKLVEIPVTLAAAGGVLVGNTLAKTGVARQADLIALIQRLTPSLARPRQERTRTNC